MAHHSDIRPEQWQEIARASGIELGRSQAREDQLRQGLVAIMDGGLTGEAAAARAEAALDEWMESKHPGWVGSNAQRIDRAERAKRRAASRAP